MMFQVASYLDYSRLLIKNLLFTKCITKSIITSIIFDEANEHLSLGAFVKNQEKVPRSRRMAPAFGG